MKANPLQKKSLSTEFSGSYFPVVALNTGKCKSRKTPFLDTFHAVNTLDSIHFA